MSYDHYRVGGLVAALHELEKGTILVRLSHLMCGSISTMDWLNFDQLFVKVISFTYSISFQLQK